MNTNLRGGGGEQRGGRKGDRPTRDKDNPKINNVADIRARDPGMVYKALVVILVMMLAGAFYTTLGLTGEDLKEASGYNVVAFQRMMITLKFSMETKRSLASPFLNALINDPVQPFTVPGNVGVETNNNPGELLAFDILDGILQASASSPLKKLFDSKRSSSNNLANFYRAMDVIPSLTVDRTVNKIRTPAVMISTAILNIEDEIETRAADARGGTRRAVPAGEDPDAGGPAARGPVRGPARGVIRLDAPVDARPVDARPVDAGPAGTASGGRRIKAVIEDIDEIEDFDSEAEVEAGAEAGAESEDEAVAESEDEAVAESEDADKTEEDDGTEYRGNGDEPARDTWGNNTRPKPKRIRRTPEQIKVDEDLKAEKQAKRLATFAENRALKEQAAHAKKAANALKRAAADKAKEENRAAAAKAKEENKAAAAAAKEAEKKAKEAETKAAAAAKEAEKKAKDAETKAAAKDAEKKVKGAAKTAAPKPVKKVTKGKQVKKVTGAYDSSGNFVSDEDDSDESSAGVLGSGASTPKSRSVIRKRRRSSESTSPEKRKIPKTTTRLMKKKFTVDDTLYQAFNEDDHEIIYIYLDSYYFVQYQYETGVDDRSPWAVRKTFRANQRPSLNDHYHAVLYDYTVTHPDLLPENFMPIGRLTLSLDNHRGEGAEFPGADWTPLEDPLTMETLVYFPYERWTKDPSLVGREVLIAHNGRQVAYGSFHNSQEEDGRRLCCIMYPDYASRVNYVSPSSIPDGFKCDDLNCVSCGPAYHTRSGPNMSYIGPGCLHVLSLLKLHLKSKKYDVCSMYNCNCILLLDRYTFGICDSNGEFDGEESLVCCMNCANRIDPAGRRRLFNTLSRTEMATRVQVLYEEEAIFHSLVALDVDVMRNAIDELARNHPTMTLTPHTIPPAMYTGPAVGPTVGLAVGPGNLIGPLVAHGVPVVGPHGNDVPVVQDVPVFGALTVPPFTAFSPPKAPTSVRRQPVRKPLGTGVDPVDAWKKPIQCAFRPVDVNESEGFSRTSPFYGPFIRDAPIPNPIPIPINPVPSRFPPLEMEVVKPRLVASSIHLDVRFTYDELGALRARLAGVNTRLQAGIDELYHNGRRLEDVFNLIGADFFAPTDAEMRALLVGRVYNDLSPDDRNAFNELVIESRRMDARGVIEKNGAELSRLHSESMLHLQVIADARLIANDGTLREAFAARDARNKPAAVPAALASLVQALPAPALPAPTPEVLTATPALPTPEVRTATPAPEVRTATPALHTPEVQMADVVIDDLNVRCSQINPRLPVGRTLERHRLETLESFDAFVIATEDYDARIQCQVSELDEMIASTRDKLVNKLDDDKKAEQVADEACTRLNSELERSRQRVVVLERMIRENSDLLNAKLKGTSSPECSQLDESQLPVPDVSDLSKAITESTDELVALRKHIKTVVANHRDARTASSVARDRRMASSDDLELLDDTDDITMLKEIISTTRSNLELLHANRQHAISVLRAEERARKNEAKRVARLAEFEARRLAELESIAADARRLAELESDLEAIRLAEAEKLAAELAEAEAAASVARLAEELAEATRLAEAAKLANELAEATRLAEAAKLAAELEDVLRLAEAEIAMAKAARQAEIAGLRLYVRDVYNQWGYKIINFFLFKTAALELTLTAMTLLASTDSFGPRLMHAFTPFLAMLEICAEYKTLHHVSFEDFQGQVDALFKVWSVELSRRMSEVYSVFCDYMEEMREYAYTNAEFGDFFGDHTAMLESVHENLTEFLTKLRAFRVVVRSASTPGLYREDLDQAAPVVTAPIVTAPVVDGGLELMDLDTRDLDSTTSPGASHAGSVHGDPASPRAAESCPHGQPVESAKNSDASDDESSKDDGKSDHGSDASPRASSESCPHGQPVESANNSDASDDESFGSDASEEL